MEPQEDGFSFYPIEIVSNDLNHYFEDDSDEEEEGKNMTLHYKEIINYLNSLNSYVL